MRERDRFETELPFLRRHGAENGLFRIGGLVFCRYHLPYSAAALPMGWLVVLKVTGMLVAYPWFSNR